METGRKYRAYPNDQLAPVLAGWIGCVRAVYNRKDEEERYLEWLRRRTVLSPSWHATGGLPEDQSSFVGNQAYSQHKGNRTEEPWMFQVPSQLYRNAMCQRSRAWQRFFANPREVGPPGRRIKGLTDSLWLTKELFVWLGDGRVQLSTKGRVVGILDFHQHRPCGTPNSLTLSHDAAGRWWVSLSFDDEVQGVTQEEFIDSLRTKSNEEIADLVAAHDLGVVRTVTSSEQKVFVMSEAKQAKLVRWRKRCKRLQRKLARQVKGSARRRKTRRKLARTHSRVADMRNDFSHQVSHALVTKTQATISGFEGLNIRGMVRRPKPVKDEDGKFVPNGAAAKAGLNQAILAQNWGKIRRYAAYKAPRAGKLFVTVHPGHSSQECSHCGDSSPLNRITQAEFHCQACGFTANADDNASAVLKQRIVALILAVLGRRTDITPVEAATRLGLSTLRPTKRVSEAPTSPLKRHGGCRSPRALHA